MSNRLAGENSPYLLQHAENPVDWYPWGKEALQRAKDEGRPIFLSVGYAACHWCHVMAHESFEDPQIASFLNEHFVSVKVDREERPDLDQLYMEAVQMMTARGGWPMSVFLTPDLEPFFGGTYWPPHSRWGMPGFDQVLQAVADTWTNRRQETLEQAQRLTGYLRQTLPTADTDEALLERLQQQPVAGFLVDHPLKEAEEALRRAYDPAHGGFGGAPKFPPAIALRVLLRRWHRDRNEQLLNMVRGTLDHMAAGGIYDHLGGGFHRYSVDELWLVPHFEKMLYDNAMLAITYLEAWQATGHDDYARVVRETLDYVLRDMTDPLGGFHGTEDADSEGREGAYYLWTPQQVCDVLGPTAATTFSRFYDVTDDGNFEGENILNRSKSVEQLARIVERDPREVRAELAESRAKLLAAREHRVRPGRDDKVLVSWNGLMIDALAQAGAALAEPRYLEAAGRAADFLLTHVVDDRGRLLHYWRQGKAQVRAFLDDFASLANALVSLYQAGFESRWIDQAVRLGDEILVRFADAQHGGFFYTANDQQEVIARKKDIFDSSVPSGTGLATMALLRLGKLCGRDDFLDAARQSLTASIAQLERASTGAGQMLLALDMELGPTPEIAILGGGDASANAAVLERLHRAYVPNKVAAYRGPAPEDRPSPSLASLFRGKEPSGPGPTLFVCENFACQAPVSGKEAALSAIDDMTRAVVEKM